MVHLVTGTGTLWIAEEHLVLSRRRVTHLMPNGEWSGIPRENFAFARRLRKEMSPPERVLWSCLRGEQLGVRFRKQHPIGPYIADFYARACGLVVEVDGESHALTQETRNHDLVRDQFMADLGLTVLRFSAYDVGTNLDGAVREIMLHTRQRVLKSNPALQWRAASTLHAGDRLCAHSTQGHTSVIATHCTQQREEVYDLQLENSAGYMTHYCVIQSS